MSRAFILSASSFSLCLPFKSQPSVIFVSGDTLHLSSDTVFPKPLPPEVANSTIAVSYTHLDISAPDAIAAAKADGAVTAAIEGKSIIKELYVPKKLVNIVVK